MAVNKGSAEIGKVYKGTNRIGKIYRGSELIYSAELPVVSPSTITLYSGDPGVGYWSDYSYTDYFDLTGYSKLTGKLNIHVHVNATTTHGFSGEAHLYLVSSSGDFTPIGYVNTGSNFAGDYYNSVNINHSVAGLKGTYRIALRNSNFRENTYVAADGYSSASVENLLLTNE